MILSESDTDHAPAWSGTISGKAEYQDFAGTAYPIRFAYVEISNEDPDAQFAVLGQGSTDFDGTFSIPVTCTETDHVPDVQVIVYAKCPEGFLANVAPSKSDPYYALTS